jgi:hypothetical protein
LIQIKASVGRSTEKHNMSKPKLLRDVILVVAAKVILVIAASVFVFDSANRPNINSASVESRLILSGPSSSSRNSTP